MRVAASGKLPSPVIVTFPYLCMTVEAGRALPRVSASLPNNVMRPTKQAHFLVGLKAVQIPAQGHKGKQKETLNCPSHCLPASIPSTAGLTLWTEHIAVWYESYVFMYCHVYLTF